MKQLSERERNIVKLIPVGHEKAISMRKLANLTHLDERDVRNIVYHLVVDSDIPIGSSNEPDTGGYFIIKDRQDMEVAAKHIKPRAVAIYRRVRALEKMEQEMFDGQLTSFDDDK